VELLDTGAIDIEYLPRADRYGRRLAHLRVDGEDVGAVLIRERLAVPYNGRGPKMVVSAAPAIAIPSGLPLIRVVAYPLGQCRNGMA
jgi:endonuclease YncB( thermonuclease family)